MGSETRGEMLREFVDWQGASYRVDRHQGRIRAVKVLGFKSRNGRLYLPEALQEAAPLYEGAKVNVNHAPGAMPGVRDYRDRLGVIRQVVLRPEEGLFADLHFNPKHPLAEQLAWDAEHCPENVGLSHHVEARLARREGQTVVEAILRVHSVDVVADPATTQGLFESADPQAERIAALEAELVRLRAVEAEAKRRLLIRRLLAEQHMPDPESADPLARLIASAEFIEGLLAVPEETTVRALVEDRARLVRMLARSRTGGRPAEVLGGGDRLGADRPMAKDQLALVGMVRNVQEFVRAIT